METLGAGGVLGSASGGISGNAAAGLGRYMADASSNVAKQAFDMTMPALMQRYAAQAAGGLQQYGNEYARNMALWNAQNQARQAPWGMVTPLMGGTYPNTIIGDTDKSRLGNSLGTGLLAYFLQ